MRFSIGDEVRVRWATPPGHVRTPYYCRGLSGRIERICGQFHNPEELAYGRTGDTVVTLYRVRFQQKTLWPDYTGPEKDTVDIEVFEHCLETAQ